MRNWTNWEAHVERKIFLETTRYSKRKDGLAVTYHLGHDRERNNKYVTEMTEETQDDHIDYIGESTGKLVAKARPKQAVTPTTFSTATLPYDQRDWIDVEPGPFDTSCFEVSQKMIRLRRHDPSVLREEDGAVEFRILASMFHSKFAFSQHWSIRAWMNSLHKGGGPKKEISLLCGSIPR